jgi:hypothetical protein
VLICVGGGLHATEQQSIVDCQKGDVGQIGSRLASLVHDQLTRRNGGLAFGV